MCLETPTGVSKGTGRSADDNGSAALSLREAVVRLVPLETPPFSFWAVCIYFHLIIYNGIVFRITEITVSDIRRGTRNNTIERKS